MLTDLAPTDDLGSYRGFALTGYYKGLRQNALAWDYFLTARPLDGGGLFSVHAHALTVDGDAVLRIYGSRSMDAVLAERARREAMWLIDRGAWTGREIHRVPVEP